MPVIPIIFRGRLNLDDNISLLPEGDFIEALNITRDQVGAQRDLAVSNLVSNRIRRTIDTPSGTTKTIGAKPDSIRNRIYYFNYNSDGYHRIEYFDFSSDSTVVLLEDDPLSPVLNFDENDKIIDADIIYRDDDGDLLYWNQRTLTPRKINVATAIAGEYAPLEDAFIEAAKRPPLFPPLAEYVTDPNIKVNNLKGKLFEFAYRFIYDDFEKSTFSPLSASPQPTLDYLASLNPISNNGLQLTVETGNKFVTKIEVAFRYNIGNVYSDYSSLVVLNKEDLGIANNSTYEFIFANDGAYPLIDEADTLNYADSFPKKANAQCLANGSYLVYGGITEGGNGLQRGDLVVTAQVTYEEVEIPEGVIVIGNPSMTINQTDVNPPTLQWDFTIGATVTPGDQYLVICDLFNGVEYFNFQYTALLGDDRNVVANYFVTQINAFSEPPGTSATATFTGSGGFHVSIFNAFGPHFSRSGTIAATSSGGGGAFFDRIYKAGGKFRLGMIYFDEQGRVIGNPVNTYTTTPGDINDFEVEIDEFYATPNDYIRPVIELTVQHLPPAEAKSFSFLRTNNLLVQSFFDFKTDNFVADGGFWYVSVQDVIDFTTDNPNWSSQWTYQEGDRIKFMYKFNGANASGYDSTYSPTLDFPIIGVVLKTFSPAPEQSYIKIQIYPGTVTPTPDDDLVFEVYRPSVKTSESQQIYYEFGETYQCVVIDGVNYHEGQNATTNPTFEFRDGDIYIRIRSGVGDDYLILDPNFSDYYPSAVNSNGREFIVNENARETYFPATVRFSQAYQFNTSINGLNRFYEDNFDDYNRAFGDITKLAIRASYMQVFQLFRIGRVGVFQQILKDQAGSDNLIISDRLLNPITYYTGDYGLGVPESFATNNYASYGCDNIRGVIWRLSLDGVEPISILYKVNSFATAQLPLRTGDSKIYGVFNAQTNRYEFSMEEAPPENAMTIGEQTQFAFSETYLVAVNQQNACTGASLVLYTGIEFEVGVILYTDEALTTPLTGYNYVVVGGIIYNINSVTGEVEAATGFECNTGIFGNYIIDTVLSEICDNIPQGLYTNAAFGTGAIVYLDSSLSTPLTGYNYIGSEGVIYEIDSVTGEVGALTGIECGSGTAGTYILGNDSGTVCAGDPVILYTDGPFAIGQILYLDASLTTPVTGFAFVVNVGDDTIYDLDNVTGEVLSTTGLTCGGGGDNFFVDNSSTSGIIDNVLPVVYTITSGSFPLSGGQVVIGVHLGFSASLGVVISGSITGNLELFKNSAHAETIPVSGPGSYSFDAVTFTSADLCEITLTDV